jgi:uncharacterized phage-like protein YoqJ
MNVILSEKSKSLAFTGHRTIPIERQDEIRARLVEAVSVACKSGITCFYSGMAMGFDLMAAETVLSLKGRYPDIYGSLPLFLSEDRAAGGLLWK